MSPPPPDPIRTLFLTEAVLKLIGGAIFIFSPASILKNLTTRPHTAVSLALIQTFGTQTVAFAVPLFLAARGDAASRGCRRLVYWGLLAREGLLALGLVARLGGLLGRERNREREQGGERLLEEGRGLVGGDEEEERGALKRGLGLWVWELVPFVVARVWVLGWRGRWLE